MENTKEIKVLDIIIAFIKAVKKTQIIENDCQYYLEDDVNCLWGAKYLLGQILRQYRINKDHIFVSVAADKLWREITDGKEKIENYHYTKNVHVYKECKLDLYKGASKHPSDKEKLIPVNGTFQYRQVFHDEHVIPIADIIEKLITFDDLNYENVQSVLNNIYICRMLKRENCGLSHKGRSWSIKETIETTYRQHNIEIVGWEDKKINYNPKFGAISMVNFP